MLNLSPSEVTCQQSLSGQPRNPPPPPSTATLSPKLTQRPGKCGPKPITRSRPGLCGCQPRRGSSLSPRRPGDSAALPAETRRRPWASASRQAHARPSVPGGLLRSPARLHLSRPTRRVAVRPSPALTSGPRPPPAAGPARPGRRGRAPRGCLPTSRGAASASGEYCVSRRGAGVKGRRKEGGSAPAAPRPALRDPEPGR